MGISPGRGQRLREIFWEFCGIFSKVGLIFNSIVRVYSYYFFIFLGDVGRETMQGWLG